ncbi:MAG: tRNA (guanine(26)-N(2))-dimethyltransferase [Thermoplasmata archaeon]
MSSAGLVTVREGTTELMVPSDFNLRGPGSRTGGVFYNRQMEFGRDVSVMFGRAAFAEGSKILDGLAATGARGLRLANECGIRAEFVLNDKNLGAAVIMKQNAELNSLEHVRIECRDLRALLAEEQFDYIDIDPFGTPVPFIDSAIQSCRNGGILAMTATDTAPLYGTYPRTSLRRYGALSQRSPFAHETGLRILIGSVVRRAAAHDRAVQPLLCYHADHYFRCYLGLRDGASRADRALDQLGYAHYDAKTLARGLVKEGPGLTMAGPLWSGALFSRDILSRMRATGDLGTAQRCSRMLELWHEEERSPPLYFTEDELSRRTKVSPPRLTEFVQFLVERGARASRTHFDPKGLKTDLQARELIAEYRAFAKRVKSSSQKA